MKLAPAIILNTLSDKQLLNLLLNSCVGVMPTDTVYGLVCRAANETAVERLYVLKKRDQKPGTIIAASIEQLVELGIKARYLKAVEQFWPNPLSIVIPIGAELSYIHLGKHSVACRVIKGPNKLLNVLSVTGPLLTTSANLAGKPEAKTIEEARKYFDDSVDFYIDGGNLAGRKPSTVIRVIDDAIEVLRQGAIKMDETGRITS